MSDSPAGMDAPVLPGTAGPVRFRLAILYGAMLVACVVLFLLIDARGTKLVAPEATAATPAVQSHASGHGNPLFHLLLALAAVVVAGRLLGAAFKYVGQPPVIGEVIAGILLGPSLLGRVAPAAATYILPPEVAPHLGMLAQFGVILYMFVVGLELDTRVLRERGHATVAISHASIVVPFLLGSSLALWLYPLLSSRDVPFTVFALFLGAAMAVTAFPVLARILTDRGISRTPLGVVALTCAAVDDVTAWCLLAFVVSVARANVGGAFVTISLTIGYIALMFLVVRPLLLRFGFRLSGGQTTQGMMALVLIGLLLSTLTTELIGIHAVFGAFLMGAVIPHDSDVARDLIHKLEDFVSVLLLPAFFAFTGMRTQIGLVFGWENWLLCGLIILVATAGKFGGTVAAARFTGLGWRDASSLGILMNTRGLMGLIVLNVGLDLGVISPTLFAMMVLMALVTTLMTSPVLVAIERRRSDPPAPPPP